MIESIEFTNYKALRKTTLPLAPFTLLLGPNGSGKSSVLQALQGFAKICTAWKKEISLPGAIAFPTRPMAAPPNAMAPGSPVQITLRVRNEEVAGTILFEWPSETSTTEITIQLKEEKGTPISQPKLRAVFEWLGAMQTFAFDPVVLAKSSPVNSDRMGSDGLGLAAVLDDLKDNYPERWDSLLSELREWLPEYDHIQFSKPQGGHKGIVLRTKKGRHSIPATELSQGTLVALALLTLAYLPNPPSLIGLEEIDRGLHPRLLRHLQDALYRLSYPENCGEKRPPIQVIATTHSPYLLDLYRDHPEEVVLAEKEGLEVQFKQLSKIEHFAEILGEGPLSEIWYSGVLGGVSVKP